MNNKSKIILVKIIALMFFYVLMSWITNTFDLMQWHWFWKVVYSLLLVKIMGAEVR